VVTGACGIRKGGLTAERQQFREELRLKAAGRFAWGEVSSVIANDLREELAGNSVRQAPCGADGAQQSGNLLAEDVHPTAQDGTDQAPCP
jgi:hypothetical protein